MIVSDPRRSVSISAHFLPIHDLSAASARLSRRSTKILSRLAVATGLLAGLCGVLAFSNAPAHAQTATVIGQITSFGSGFNNAHGIITDPAGNIYVADYGSGNVYKETYDTATGAYTQSVLFSGFGHAVGLTEDASGNFYIAALSNVYKETLSAGAYSTSSIGSFSSAIGLAIDPSGNVFVADTGTNSLYELAAGAYTRTTLATNLNGPYRVSIDASRNLYVGNVGGTTIAKETYSGGTYTESTIQSANAPYGIAIDPAGDLFYGTNNSTIDELVFSGGTYTNQVYYDYQAQDLALDSAGNLYSISYFFGNGIKIAANPDFGSVAVGTAATQMSIAFQISTAGTLGATQVLTQGVSGLDLTLGTGSTCTGAVTANQSCVVNVAFTPQAPGLRAGAVELTNSAGTVIATAYVSGVGTAPLVGYAGNAPTTVLYVPAMSSLAVDASDNLFYSSNLAAGFVYKRTPAGAITTYPQFYGPVALTVDGAGNLYYVSSGAAETRPVEVFAPGTSVSPTNTLSYQSNGQIQGLNMAADAAGNLYIPGPTGVTKLTRSAAYAQTSIGSSAIVNAVAVDAAGNVYAATQSNTIELITPSDQVTSIISGLNNPIAIALDAAGDIYVSNYGASNVVRYSVGTYAALTVASGFLPTGLAVDSAGNLYVGDGSNQSVVKIAVATPPSLTFPSTPYDATSSALTVNLENNGNLPLPFPEPASGSSPSLSSTQFVMEDSSTCPQLTSSSLPATVAAGGTCTYLVNFEPTSIGAITGSMAISDNNLNVTPAATQTVALNGTGAPATPTITFSVANQTYGTTPFTVGATSNSTGAFTYSVVSGPATISGASVTLTGIGSVVLQATEAASTDYVAGSTNATFTVSATAPTVTFSVPNHTYGDAPFTVAATSNSAGAITYSVLSGPASISGATVTLTGSGPVTLQASQAAAGNYIAGTQQATFTVAAGTAAITFTLPNHTFGDAAFVVSASSSSTGTFTYTVVSGPATISSSTVTLTGAGTVVLQAAQAAAGNYAANTRQSTFTVATGTAAVTFTVPNHTYGDAPFTVAATSSSTGAFTYAVVSGPATISGSTVTLSGAGTVALQASQAATTNYIANTQQATFTVSAGTAPITFSVPNHTYGDAPFTVAATSTSTGAFTYTVVSGAATISGSTVTLSGAGTVVLQASQAATTNNIAGTKQATFSVAAGTAAITFTVPNHTYGDAAFSVAGTSSSTGAFTYIVVSGPATISASLVTLTGTGAVILQASQAATANYAANTQQAGFSVSPANPAISFNVPNHTYGDAPFAVAATSNSSGAFTYTVLSGPATIAGSTVTVTGVGPVVLQASQAAAANYNAGISDATFSVSQAGSAPITFTVPNRTFGAAPFTVTASSISTGTFTYAVLSGPASIAGNTLTIGGAGTIVIQASQAATANYAAGSASTTFMVSVESPTITFTVPGQTFGSAPYSVAATSNSPGAFTYSVVSGPATITGSVVSLTGAGTVVLQASQAGTVNYAAGMKQVSITSALGSPAIAFAVSNHIFGDAAFAVSATSNSTGAFTYSVISGPATISGSLVTLTGAGTVVLQASEAVDSNYTAGTRQAAFNVSAGSTPITFAVPNHNFGDAPFIVAATSSSTGAFTYTVVSGPATVSGSTVSLTAIGTVVLQASQAADANHTAGATQARFTVSSVNLVVAANNATRYYGAPNPSFTGIVSGAKYSESFTETFSTSASTTSPVGNYPIVPVAVGADLNDYTMTTQDGTLSVSQAPTTLSLSSSSATENPNQNVTVTANVVSSTSGTPTGTVSFFDNGFAMKTVALTSGVAQYATTLSPATTHLITATYSGDTNFLSSLTASSGLGVETGVLAFTFNSTGQTALTVAPGQQATYNFALTPTFGNYAGAVTFAVSGLPMGATASFTPANVAASSGAQAVTMTINTQSPVAHNSTLFNSTGRGMATPLLALLLLPLAGSRKFRRRLNSRMLTMILLLAGLSGVAAVITGCASTGKGFLDSSAQTYHVTVTATSGSLQQSSSVTLNVQ